MKRIRNAFNKTKWKNIDHGFTSELKKQWKDNWFNYEQTKEWIGVGLKVGDADYAKWLRDIKKVVSTDWVLNYGNDKELRKEYERYLQNGKSPAQEWLDKNYPKNQRGKIKKLDISNKDLEGYLNLADFSNLEELYCGGNKLTHFNIYGVSKCSNLRRLHCSDNQLLELNLRICNELEYLHCSKNQLIDLRLSNERRKLKKLIIHENRLEQDLTFLENFINLEELYIGGNFFYGSLEPLKNLSSLRCLDISDTNVNSGLEYLPSSIEELHCYTFTSPQAKVGKIYESLQLFSLDEKKGKYDWKKWREFGIDLSSLQSTREEESWWKNIHPKFTLELQKEWEKRGFDREQVEMLISIGIKPSDDIEFVVWFRDEMAHLMIKEYKKPSFIKEFKFNAEFVSKEAVEILKKKCEGYRKTYEVVKGWKKINSGFSLYQIKEWMELKFTYEQAKRWVEVGLTPEDADLACSLLEKGYTPESLSNKLYEIEDLRNSWKNWRRLQILIKELEELKKNNPDWKGSDHHLKMVEETIMIRKNLQLSEFIEKQYPNKHTVKVINLESMEISGELVINNFSQLEEIYLERQNLAKLQISNCPRLVSLNCAANLKDGKTTLKELIIFNCPNLKKLDSVANELTTLDLSNNLQLTELLCFYNSLTDLNVRNCPNLKSLYCSINFLTKLDLKDNLELEKLDIGNNFFDQDLSFLMHLTNLKDLSLGDIDFDFDLKKKTYRERGIGRSFYNNFYGSLEPLKNLTKLEFLYISETDIDSGLEYLPSSLKKFYCSAMARPQAKVKEIEKFFLIYEKKKGEGNKYYYDFQPWKETFEEVKLVLQLGSKEINNKIESSSKKLLEQKIKEKLEKENVSIQETDKFKTWFNPNCFIVISRKKEKEYIVWVVIHEPKYEKMEEIFEFIKVFKHKTLLEVQKKIREIKKYLDSSNPVLAIANNNISITDVIKKTHLEQKDISNDPDKYLKPLDIVWRKNRSNIMLPTTYHAAIYLGNGLISHISPYSLLISQLNAKIEEYQNKLGKKAVRELGETDELLKVEMDKLKKEKEKIKKQGEKDNIRIERDNIKTQISTWEKFLGKSQEKLIRHHPIIPFKKPEIILEHVAKTALSNYAKGEYNIFSQNCEHFATLCVCGIPFSEQSTDRLKLLFGNIDLVNEIQDSDNKFAATELEVVFNEVKKIASEETKDQLLQGQIETPPKK